MKVSKISLQAISKSPIHFKAKKENADCLECTPRFFIENYTYSSCKNCIKPEEAEFLKNVVCEEVNKLIDEGIICNTRGELRMAPADEILENYDKIQEVYIPALKRTEISGINDKGNKRSLYFKDDEDNNGLDCICDKKPYRVLYFKNGILSGIRKNNIGCYFKDGCLTKLDIVLNNGRKEYNFDCEA